MLAQYKLKEIDFKFTSLSWKFEFMKKTLPEKLSNDNKQYKQKERFVYTISFKHFVIPSRGDPYFVMVPILHSSIFIKVDYLRRLSPNISLTPTVLCCNIFPFLTIPCSTGLPIPENIRLLFLK